MDKTAQPTPENKLYLRGSSVLAHTARRLCSICTALRRYFPAFLLSCSVTVIPSLFTLSSATQIILPSLFSVLAPWPSDTRLRCCRVPSALIGLLLRVGALHLIILHLQPRIGRSYPPPLSRRALSHSNHLRSCKKSRTTFQNLMQLTKLDCDNMHVDLLKERKTYLHLFLKTEASQPKPCVPRGALGGEK